MHVTILSTTKAAYTITCSHSSRPGKHIWVPTEKGIPNVPIDLPQNPCTVCHGWKKVPCAHCKGKGRLNFPDKGILPRGQWPQWCLNCRGSGLWFCQRCMGTGVKRDPIGFRLPDPQDKE